MADLSPAAQAVLDAAETGLDGYIELLPPTWKSSVAAALRAVADHAQRSGYAATPSTDWGNGWKSGVNDTAQGLLAIAAELENV